MPKYTIEELREARLQQKKYMEAYEEEKVAMRREVVAAETCKSQISKTEGDLSQYKSKIRNLESRLEEINQIINVFDTQIDNIIQVASDFAKTLEDKYSSAIRCSGIAVNGISMAYSVKSVNSEPNSNAAYNACVNEKNRLETQISTLNEQITSAKRQIESLQSQKMGHVSSWESHKYNANFYRRKADSYTF